MSELGQTIKSKQLALHSLLPRFKALQVLISLFIGALLITNVITSKYLQIANFTFTAGALSYPFTFSILDIIIELYGKEKAKHVVWLGFFASLLMTSIIFIAQKVPIDEVHSPITQNNFELVFGFMPGIVLGSMTAYLTAQLIDVQLFEWIKTCTKGRYLWIRNNVSTLCSQLIDTAIFGLVAWIIWPRMGLSEAITPVEWKDWYTITINEYAFKVIFTFLNIPFVYAGVYGIKWLANKQAIKQ